MAPTQAYTPLHASSKQKKDTPVWIRISWFFQAAIAILRILFVALTLGVAMLLASMMNAPAAVIIGVILYEILSRWHPVLD